MTASTTSPLQNVSRETFSPLTDYVALLLKWNRAINLIGPATESQVWSRHIDDSSQIVELIPSGAASLVDLGSGAGLPGMVIALARPDLKVTLVEQDQRKAAFLKEAKRLLGLSNVTVEAMDLAKLTRRYDVVTARALAPLAQLLPMAHRLLQPGGTGIFPKGANYADELAEARRHWRFSQGLKPSKTNAESSLITITELNRIREDD
ncbi:MAG: 16S rRNA (guanine(527)-N(7))-methyltransferase RsmG [Alphaproteobacteria bacterium]|nr:16S rRNA (guanine(527)-N(7))-methyltransferase RsmG [Alphaproteobacteria bacterium]